MIINATLAGKGINPAKYHEETAKRGTAEFRMGSSSLREFGRCARRWVNGFESADSKSTEFGSLLDCLALTPDQFKLRYAVQPATYWSEKEGEDKPWSNNAKACKEWNEEHEKYEIISAKLHKQAKDAVARLREDVTIRSFLDDSDTQVHVTAQWKDEATGLIVPLKILLDLVPRDTSEFAKCLGDLKSTRSAAIMPWERFCFSAGYHIQAAFYTDIYTLATGEDRTDWCFILQENVEPWQTGKRLLSQDFLELGRAEYKRLLANYCYCLKHNHWPDYDEHDEAVQNWTVVRPSPWMASAEQFAPKFAAEKQEPEVDEAGGITP